jgi:fructose-1-phosphate kinase PfkB-like protein
METYPAGKGVNFCRAAACFGKAETLLLQFAGGSNGKRLREALDMEGIRHETIETEAETRCCITCLDSAHSSMTELIEPSSRVTPSEAEKFLNCLKAKLGNASLFAISGSLPDRTDISLYERAAGIAVSAGIPVLADAVKGIAPVLELPGRIILKVNRDEFLRLTECDGLQLALKYASKRWRNACFAITDGSGNAVFSDGERYVSCSLPRLKRVISPLGAGDTASAVLASCITTGTELPKAFCTALASASANCLSERAGEFQKNDMEALLPQIQLSESFSLDSNP